MILEVLVMTDTQYLATTAMVSSKYHRVSSTERAVDMFLCYEVATGIYCSK